jgi:lysozyme family protein
MTYFQPTPKFLRTHKVTSGWEGGWSNNKADPGGKTMFGVTEARFHEWLDSQGQKRRPVASITHAEALQIYFSGYWQKLDCERLFPGVDLAVYDAGVNSGPARAEKWLYSSLDPKSRHDRTVKAICAKRLGFVQSLKHFATFGRGWTNRISDVQAKGVAWALSAMGESHTVADHLRDEAAAKKAAANKQTTGGLATGTGTGGTAIAVDSAPAPIDPALPIDPASLGPQMADWLLAGLGLTLLAVTAWLFWRAYLNTQQAAAYRREAGIYHVA